MTRAAFGLIGIGTMGSNLALNFEDHGISVAFWNREQDRTRAFAAAHPDRDLLPTYTFEELVRSLERPRRILMMIPAGDPVDQTLARLAPLLEPGDVAIDGGNSLFHDTRRRAAELAARGLHFFGVGISGGSEGARTGPSLMVGGPFEAYGILAPALEAIAARTETGPCVGWLGPDGAGHFVKMVHNAIEYVMLQGYGEGLELLQASGYDLDLLQISKLWTHASVVRSWLLDLLVRALEADPKLATVKGFVEDSGEGRWTLHEAIERAVPMPALADSLFARFHSRQPESFSAKVIAALRNQFGGHAVAKE